MPRIVDVQLNADGTVTYADERLDGPADATLRRVLAEIAEDAEASDSDTVVKVHRPDGVVKTINALRDGGLRRPLINQAASARRTPAPPALPESNARRGMASRWTLAAAVLTCVVGVSAAYVALTSEGDSPTAPGEQNPPAQGPPARPDLSRLAPTGWTSHVNWDLAPVGDFTPLPTGDRIVYLTPEGSVRAVNANGGAVIWESLPLSPPASSAPVVGGSGDDAFVAIKTGSSIALISLTPVAAHVQAAVLPSTPTATLTSSGEGILVSDDNTVPTILTTQGALAPLTVPAGQAVYEILADNTAVAAPAEGAWSILTIGSQPDHQVTPTTPAGATGQPHPVSCVRGVVVAWWNTVDPQTRLLAFHDARTGAVLAATTVPAAVVDKPLPTVVSDDRTLLSAGPVLAHTSTGDTRYLEAWKPSNTTSGNIFGSLTTDTGTTRALWPGHGDITALPEGSAVPWLVTDDGSAVVLDQLGDITRIAALRKRGQ